VSDVDTSNDIFCFARDADAAAFGVPDHFHRWLFAERLGARGECKEIGFDAWEGPAHLTKFFQWHSNAKHPDPFPAARMDPLVAASVEVDARVFEVLGLPPHSRVVEKIGRYNAQDHVLLNMVPGPERDRVRVQLDFGPGHGRLAALAFRAPDPDERIRTLFAVDAVPSTYLTQLTYYRAMGLRVWEYLDHAVSDPDVETVRAAMADHDVIHLPTWRFDLVPDGVVDRVTCVQVLKELPGGLVAALFPMLARVLHSSGALYVRDHIQFHSPNQMPIDLLLQAAGFACEFAPMWRDREDIHGLPRIWRKVDPMQFVGSLNQ
jgi:hypothetical protein